MKSGRYKNASVFIRIAPSPKMCWKYVKILSDKKTMYIRRLQDFERGYEDRPPLYWKFKTDGIFYNTPQDEIYTNIVTTEIIDSAFNGNNVIIASYGPTGSGKSLTTSGLFLTYEDRGLAPRIISTLFAMKETLKEKHKVCIKMSYIETKKIYITDLLNPEPTFYDANNLKKIKSIKVQDEYHALKTLFKAESRRDFVDKSSYYSHSGNSVLTLEIYTKSAMVSNSNIKTSKIHLVDLGGADTIGNLSCMYKSVLEIGNANLAKSHLEQFLLILTDNIPEQVLVKKRLNVLLLYLKDSLNSSSLLRFIGHVSTERTDLMLALSMLRFGEIVKDIKCHALKSNEIVDPDAESQLLHAKLNELKREKYLSSIFLNKDLSNGMTERRLEHLKRVVYEYLKNDIDEIELFHLGDVNAVIKVFKDMYNQLEMDKAECVKDAYTKVYEEIMNTPGRKDAVNGKLSKTKNASNGSVTSRQSAKRGSKGKIKSETDSLKGGKKDLKTSSSRSLKIGKSGSVIRKGSKSKRSSDTLCRSQSFQECDGEGELPEEIPPYEVAFKIFIDNTNYNYETLQSTVNERAATCRDAQKQYIYEITTLRMLLRDSLKKKEELQTYRLQRNLYPPDYVNQKLDEREAICFKEVQDNDKLILEQKEHVLSSQAELQTFLHYYQESRNELETEFQRFCCENYRAPIPNIGDEKEVCDMYFDEVVERINELDITEAKKIQTICPKMMLFEELKNKLIKAIERKKKEKKK